jgi:hypothetical protein
MANCPNCGSEHIQLKTATEVNWGRALAGWALFGVIGGAVGAVTGNDRTANACLNCGTVYKAEDLFRLIQYIETLIEFRLDMSVEKDRFILNTFITDIQPLIQKAEMANKSYEEGLTRNNNNDSFLAALVLIPIALSWGWFAIHSGNWFWGGLAVIFAIFLIIGFVISLMTGETPEQSAQRQLKENKHKAEQDLQAKIQDFKAKI